jgi:hypothetical protein
MLFSTGSSTVHVCAATGAAAHSVIAAARIVVRRRISYLTSSGWSLVAPADADF